MSQALVPQPGNQPPSGPVVHVRAMGRSHDIPLGLLDLGSASTDAQVKSAVAGYLSQPTQTLDAFVVERHDNGNLTVRPEAVFG